MADETKKKKDAAVSYGKEGSSGYDVSYGKEGGGEVEPKGPDNTNSKSATPKKHKGAEVGNGKSAEGELDVEYGKGGASESMLAELEAIESAANGFVEALVDADDVFDCRCKVPQLSGDSA